MKNSELKEYLNTFPDDTDVSVIIANPKKRKIYPVREYGAITDAGQPVFCLEVGEQDMDSEMIAAAEEDERNAEQLKGQMEIADFPEVMP